MREPCAHAEVDAAGVVTTVNDTWLSCSGLPREAVVGQRFADLVSRTSRPNLEAALRSVAAGEAVRGLDLELLRGTDGGTASGIAAATPAGTGSLWAFLEYGEAGRTVELYRLLLEAAPEPLAIVRADGAIDYVNARLEELFGYRREELLGRPIEVLVPERLRDAHGVHRRRFGDRARAMGSGIELVGRRKDGSEVPIEVSLSPVDTPSGRVVQAAVRDIAARRKLEAETALAHERLRNAIESIEDAFAVLDADGRLVLHNSAYRTLFDAETGARLGERAGGLLELWENAAPVGDAPPSRPDGARDATHQGRAYRVVTRRTRDGGLVATVSDRTADVLRAEALHNASAAKSEFLSSMSHELRTPLNAVLGFAQLLQRDKKTPLTERQRGMVDHIVRGGEHLLRLIDDVLDLARIEAGRVSMSPERVDVGPVVDEVCATLAPMAARARIALEARVPADLPAARADRTRFAQILMNFGSNAIKYGQPGGRAVFVAEERAGCVRASVIDDGAGIALDKQDKLFQPFQRAGQETGPIEGTGIGLAITKRLAELMEGSVGFRSAVGQGSEFWVELPAWSAAPAEGAADEGRAPRRALLDAPGPRLRVLYIEDNPSNVAFMAALLAEFDRIELSTAASGEIGVELTRALRPAVVIADINLPGMSGFEVVARLREAPETRDIPVVALTAAAMERDAARAKQAGFYRYLTKPARVEELVEVLEEILARG